MLSTYRTTHRTTIPTTVILLLLLFIITVTRAGVRLPPCHQIPKVLCCTERVIEKCLAGCVEYIQEKCPHKLDSLFDKGDERKKETTKAATKKPPPARVVTLPPRDEELQAMLAADKETTRRRAPKNGDYRALNPAYPVTEVTDRDLTSECGVAESRPPFSPCLSRKSVDDLFLTCCQQHVPVNCHSLCTYEHRESVAAELLIAAVQQDGCDLSQLSRVLYCANQNRNNRQCCEYLGLAGEDLGVGERCLRMCNVAYSGDHVSALSKDDLVCLSNWNVIMYCARAGLRTIN